MATTKRRSKSGGSVKRTTSKRTSVGAARKKPSLEDRVADQLTAAGLGPFERQYKFHPTRKWQADFAWPRLMVILECDGGAFIGGRHVTGAGATKDNEKINAATELGWNVYRVTTPQCTRDEKGVSIKKSGNPSYVVALIMRALHRRRMNR